MILLKTADEIALMRKANQIVAEILAAVAAIVVCGGLILGVQFLH